MSVTTETDPVEAVIDVLEAGTFTLSGTDPTRIEHHGDRSPSDKAAYEDGDALYVYRSGTSFSPMDGSGDQMERVYEVSIEAWTLLGKNRAEALEEDIISILNDYWTDNKDATVFVTLRPFSGSDRTHESFGDHGQHDVVLVQGRLMRNTPV